VTEQSDDTTSANSPESPEPRPDRLLARTRGLARNWKSLAGYGWFMTGGTFLPLPIFLGAYLVDVTLIGTPLARRIYPLGLFFSTMGQPPPGQDKLKERTEAGDKKPFVERIRPYSPPGFIERRGKPVPMPLRIAWFVLVGWWLGAIWVILAWSVLLLPYPLLDVIRGLLAELPSVMTLAWPKTAEKEAVPEEEP
jgi:hypothetical protein